MLHGETLFQLAQAKGEIERLKAKNAILRGVKVEPCVALYTAGRSDTLYGIPLSRGSDLLASYFGRSGPIQLLL
jgi:hypothetical protein